VGEERQGVTKSLSISLYKRERYCDGGWGEKFIEVTPL
jgi:hypothetical protein